MNPTRPVFIEGPGPDHDPRCPAAPPAPDGPGSQRWLDAQFQQRAIRRQTFVTFHREIEPRREATYEAMREYATRFTEHTRRGLYLSGAPHTGKARLVAALVNAARGEGCTALVLSQARLLARTMPRPGEDPEEQEERRLRRKALRVVEVLAIRDLLGAPLRPAYVAELLRLLEDRARRGLVTHFTAAETPRELRRRLDPSGRQKLLAALLDRVESLTAPPLVVPPSPGQPRE
jgi:DNA replication protein DnaC